MKSFCHRGRLWLLLAAGIAVVAATIMTVVGGQVSQVTATSSVPDWLRVSVASYAESFDAAPTSAEWFETTRGQYVVAVGTQEPEVAQGMETSGRPAYVVVVHGHFVSNLPHPESKDVQYHPLEGQVLVLTFDPERQELTNVDLMHTEGDLDETSLGQANPLAL